MSDSTMFRAELRRTLMRVLNESELKSLAFDLSIDYESLPGNSKEDKARELIAYCDRNNRMVELIGALQTERPDLKLSPINGKSDVDEREDNSAIYVPEELKLGYAERKIILSAPQGRLLSYIEQIDGSGVSLSEMVKIFSEWSPNELFYRLEYLKLLGFIRNLQLDSNGDKEIGYCLSVQYRKQYERYTQFSVSQQVVMASGRSVVVGARQIIERKSNPQTPNERDTGNE